MWTDLPVGRVGLYKGHSHANTDAFRMTIHGKGGHGSRPDLAVDPILAGAHFVTSIQAIVSRNISPMETGVISVGKFQAGTASNIIPDQAMIEGTVRTFTTDNRELIMDRLAEAAKGLEKIFRVKTDYEFIDGVPSAYNDETVSADLFEAAVKFLGENHAVYLQPATGGEDFALYTQQVPGSFMRIGCTNSDKGINGPAHSPYFDLDEGALVVGVEIFTELIKAYLV